MSSGSDGTQGLLAEVEDLSTQVDELRSSVAELKTSTAARHTDYDDRLTDAAEKLEARRNDLLGIAQTVENLGADVTALKEAAAEPKAPKIRVPWWPALTAEEASEEWKALVAWVGDVIVARHPRDANDLKPCWYRHTEVVDQLSALRAMWRLAYDSPASTPLMVTDWLDRHRPNAFKAIKEALKGCQLPSATSDDETHVPVKIRGSVVPDDVELQGFIREDARGRD